jgi:hypothetical protein
VSQALLAAGLLGALRLGWAAPRPASAPKNRERRVRSVDLWSIPLVILDAAHPVSVLLDRVSAAPIWVTESHFLLGVGVNLLSHSRSEWITMTPVAPLLCMPTILVALR